MKYSLLNYKGKRPKNSISLLKKELLQYLREEYKLKHIPSRRELERRFHFGTRTLSKNIDSLYKEAGLKYRLTQNQHIKEQKADLFLKLILKNLNLFKVSLIKSRAVRERGIDIVTKKNSKKVGFELKGYNKYEKIKKKDITQIKKFLEKENLNEAIIITTTTLVEPNLDLPKNIEIINFEKLRKLFPIKDVKILMKIRYKPITITNLQRETKKQRILDYVLKKYQCEGIKPRGNDISKELHLDLYTYFKNLREIYKILNIPPPLKNRPKTDNESINIWKNEIKKYILNEVQKGKKYPSGEEIGKQFGISHIWNILKMADLYKELGLEPYLERKTRPTYAQEY